MMGERLTSIKLPGFGPGLADYGRKTPAEMIKQFRVYAEYQKEICEAVLSAPDEAFRVETYVGAYSMKRREVIQMDAQSVDAQRGTETEQHGADGGKMTHANFSERGVDLLHKKCTMYSSTRRDWPTARGNGDLL